jgi:L-seryl-tRNA(Ser) seleniumtransferase
MLMQHGRHRVLATIRESLDQHRARLKLDSSTHSVTLDQVINEVTSHLLLQNQSTVMRPVINATGIMLHTGLGRAPLASQAVQAIVEVAGRYANIEVDLLSGERGNRMRSVTGMLCDLTTAEAALVVNNNAAATMLALAVLANDREVIVSRGELIEIGGQFRLPEIMAASGAILREVGTTNITRSSDYARAINEQTAAIMLVHPSNFQCIGFTQQVSVSELVILGRERNIPVIHDIGSGAMIDFSEFGFSNEPLATRSLEQGADVVLFSGDKLLGGPQCGVILGRQDLVAAMAGHPMARALRVDKLTLAGLAATLSLYDDLEKAINEVPLLRLLKTPIETLRERAETIAAAIRSAPEVQAAEVIDDHSYLGGGSVPTQQQPTVCIAIAPKVLRLEQLACSLRGYRPAIVGRIQRGQLLIDLRTVFPDEDVTVIEAIQSLSRERIHGPV